MGDKPTMKTNRDKLAYIGSKPGTSAEPTRDSDAWLTPCVYVEMAREVMGEIDLDPFSSAAANKHVRAKRVIDPKADAFQQVWFEDQGRVFMNPPYGRQIIDAAVDIFLSHWSREAISQGVVLVNNATETRWFQSLLRTFSASCFPDRRIAFENDDGKHVSGNTRGQAFFYFGHKVNRFEEVFSRIGVVLIRSAPK